MSQRRSYGLVECAALLVSLLGLTSCGQSGLPASAPQSAVDSTHGGGRSACEALGFVPCQRQAAHLTVPIAGTSIRLTYSSDRVPGRKVDAATDAGPIGLGGWSLTVLRSLDTAANTLTYGDGRVRHVTPKAVRLGTGVLAVADPETERIDLFDARGNEVGVYDARTAARRLAFVWDAQGLKQVVDRAGVALTVVRDAAGTPVRLTSARGATTALRTSGGWLTQIRTSLASTDLTVGPTGLLTQVRDATGAVQRFEYDAAGRLTSSTDASGARTALTRTETATDLNVTATGPMGARTVDAVHTNPDGSERFTHTTPGGVETSVEQSATHSSITLADGRRIELRLKPDAQWAMDLPLIDSMSITEAGMPNAALSVSEQRSGHRALGEPQPWGDAVTVNGKTWHQEFDPTRRALRSADPAGRAVTTVFDAIGRVIERTRDGASGQRYEYGPSGRLSKLTVGSGAAARVFTYQYDPRGIATITDPAGLRFQQQFNASGTLDSVSGPGAQSVRVSRDAVSRITQFTGNGQGAYRVVRRPDGLISAITAPAGKDAPEYLLYDYDSEGQLVGLSSPDMRAVLERDTAERIGSADVGSGKWSFVADGLGRTTQAAGPNVTLTETYEGSRHIAERIQGPFDIEVRTAADAFGRPTSESVGTGAPLTFWYDAGGLITRAGDLQIERDPQTGRISQERLGTLRRAWMYDLFGDPLSETVSDAKGGVIVEVRWQRDGLGRILEQSIRSSGADVQVERYTYDEAGRLASWSSGSRTFRYSYDAAGNPQAIASADGSSAVADYDARNELLQLGAAHFSYNGAGQRIGRQGEDGATAYRYDLQGALLSVTKPGGVRTDFIVDAAGRRLASLRNGKLQYGIVYGDALHPSAELAADGTVRARYVYAGGRSPAYISKGQMEGLEVLDGTGSPRLIINAATAAVEDAIARDPFGRVLSETAPGFQRIGFAGGIVDADTGFVRFGARDYDPQTMRWTAPDPLSVTGGSANLYAYVAGDPVNRTDSSGLKPDVYQVGGSFTAAAPLGITGGVGVVFSNTQGGIYVTGGGAAGAQLGATGGVTGVTTNDGSGSIGQVGGGAASAEVGLGPMGVNVGLGSTTTSAGLSAGPTLGLSGNVTGTHVFCVVGCPDSDSDSEPEPDPALSGNCGGMDAGLCDPSPASPDDPNAGLPDDPNSPIGACSTGGTCNETGETNPYMLSARSSGEPHASTLDGLPYDLMTVGEFVGLQSDSKDLIVQLRQAPLGNSRTVSVIAAVAISALGDRIVATATRDDEIKVEVNGVVQDGRAQGGVLARGARLSRTPTDLTVLFPDHSTLIVKKNPYGLDFAALLPIARRAQIHGLLGHTDIGQVQSRDGQRFTTRQLTDLDIRYRKFADSWRITQAESLFRYERGETTATYTDESFPDRVPQLTAAQRGSAEPLCAAMALSSEEHEECILDVSLTGDAGYAASTAAIVAAATSTGRPANASGSGVQPPATAAAPALGNRIRPGDSVHGHLDSNASIRYDLDIAADSIGYFAAMPGCAQSDPLRWRIESDSGKASNDQPVCADIGRYALSHAGHYQLLVYGAHGGSGDYALTWKASRPDRELTLRAGADAAGSVELPGAQDVYQLEGAAGSVGYFAFGKGCNPAQPLRWSIELRDDPTVVSDLPLCSSSDRIVFAKAQHFILRVYSYLGGTGQYQMKWMTVRPDRQLSLKAGDSARGTLEVSGAADIYSLDAKAGTVGFFKSGTQCGAAGGIRWRLASEDGGPILDSAVCSDLGRVAFSQSGHHVLRVYSYGGGTGAYQVQWVASRADRQLSMTPGTPVRGMIDLPGALDEYSLSAHAGEVGYFKSGSECTAAAGLRWRLTAEDGTPVLDHALCSDLGRIAFPKAGRYILRVYSYLGGTGAYQVQWVASRADRQLSMRAGDQVRGTIDLPGALDDYALSANAGEVGYFKSAPDCAPTPGIRWRLASEDGATTLGDTGICSDLGKMTFAKAGRYRLRIYSDSGGTGNYRISWATTN